MNDFTKEEVKHALNIVADDIISNAKDIFKPDRFTDNMSYDEKLAYTEKWFRYASEVRLGLHNNNLTIRQKVTYVLTGKCVPILPGG